MSAKFGQHWVTEDEGLSQALILCDGFVQPNRSIDGRDYFI